MPKRFKFLLNVEHLERGMGILPMAIRSEAPTLEFWTIERDRGTPRRAWIRPFCG